MAVTEDDKRVAVTIQAGIGGQIFAASLVLMGILFGYFDLRNFKFLSLPGILLFIAILALLTSTVVAGFGLKKLRNNGNNGDWDYAKTHINFRAQTWLNYVAILLFFVVFFLPPGESKNEKILDEIDNHLVTLINQGSIANRSQEDSLLLSNNFKLIDSVFKINAPRKSGR